MSDLPEWVHALPFFDPDRWRLPIVCTGHEAHDDEGSHALELLGFAYEFGEGQLFYGGPHVRRDGARAEDPMWPRSPYLPQVPHLGSLSLSCPTCQRTVRIPAMRWAAALTRVREVSLPMLDVSDLP